MLVDLDKVDSVGSRDPGLGWVSGREQGAGHFAPVSLEKSRPRKITTRVLAYFSPRRLVFRWIRLKCFHQEQWALSISSCSF